jgi:hypothetical protein
MASTIEPNEFLARLGRTRRTIAERHVKTHAGRRTERLLARLEAYLSRPLQVVILGEPNSGKTTLINRILGQNLLATDVIQNTRSVVRIRYSAQPFVEVSDAEGRRHPIEQGVVHGHALRAGETIEVGVPLPGLAAMEILDTPGLTNDDHMRGPWAAVFRSADISVWCTIATQAWRASEVAAWRSLARPAASSLLAVTRTDLLSEADRDKVRQRLVAEAGAMFRAVLMVEGGPGKPSEEIAGRLEQIVTEIRQTRSRKAAAIIRRLAHRLDPSHEQQRAPALAPTED